MSAAQTERRHLYAVVEALCAGKRILDVACGDGSGAAALATVAASVVALDPDASIVERARRRWFRADLSFRAADPAALPLADGSVDVVLAFGALDRPGNGATLVAELRRVLAPGGVLAVATTNDERGLYAGDLRDLLMRRFSAVRLYGQRRSEASTIRPLEGARSTPRWIGVEDTAPDAPAVLVAIAGDEPLPALDSVYADETRDAPETARAAQTRHAPSIAPPPRRIVLACAMKSGSTYVASVLAAYYGARVAAPEIHEIDWEAEQNLSRSMLDQLDGSYVLQVHMKPYAMNFELLEAYGIDLALQWRNVGDMIVSIDDHLSVYGIDQPLSYVHDPGFLTLPAETRHAHLIDTALDWYVWFYLAWRKRDATFNVFERLVEDERRFFADAIAGLGDVFDERRLEAALETNHAFTRRNVGIAGRSATTLSDANKRRLEARLLAHPWAAQTEVLLWELPWPVPALSPAGPYDGRVVTADGKRFSFVSRGVRHRLKAPESWMNSRARLRPDDVVRISEADLAELRAGVALD